MTCQDARDLFSARADDALSPVEQAHLQAHLATCAECEREWVRFERTVALVQAIEPAHAPAGFVDRVMGARARPWYARLARGLFVPWPVKLPVEAAAIVLVASLAVMIFQRSPELQQASVPPEPRTESAPMLVRQSPSFTTGPLAKAGEKTTSRIASTPTPEGISPSQGSAPATTPPRREQARDAAEPPRAPAPIAAAESKAKSDEERKTLLRKEADPSDALLSARKAPAVASPPAGPTAPAPTVLEERSGSRQNLAQGYARTSAGLQAHLAVGERVAAESTVRDLVARVGGQVLSQAKDGDAVVMRLVVPADRWDEMRRGLEALGTLRVEGTKAEGSGLLLVTLRLER